MKRAWKQTSPPWGPEIARVVEIERIKTEAAIEALQDVADRCKKHMAELDRQWKASEGQSASDVIRGQWLGVDDMRDYVSKKITAMRRKVK